jgi:hypothetical protein
VYNKEGKSVLRIYAQRKFKVRNTFSTNSSYAAYHCKQYKIPSMHNIIITSKGLHRRVRTYKATENGAESDHQEVKMTLMMASIKFKKGGKLLIRNTDLE